MRNTLSIGTFTNHKLEGYGKKVLPNFVIQEGIYKNGITRYESNDEVQLKERWLSHFSDGFAIKQLDEANINPTEDTS
jgi:hypothetical protein